MIEPTFPEPLAPSIAVPAHASGASPAATDAAAAAPEMTQPAASLPTPGRTPGVGGHDPWAEAGRKVLRFHLARMLARVPGVVAGEDPEEVHAMRVAARRMRAAWRVFGDGFEREARRRYVGDLREIGVCLGAVRDLDVLLEILSAYEARQSAHGRAGLRPIREGWVGERDARRIELVELLGSEAFARFVTEYEAFAATDGLAAVPVAQHAPGLVRTRMPATAWAAYQDVWAFDDHVAGTDLVTLHQLRIAGKWLRYTLEFAREALEPEATPLIRRVVALQDHLGTQHDLHVAATLARQVAAGPATLSSHEIAVIGRFVRSLDDGVGQLGKTFGRTWRPLVAPDYRRRLGRGLARL